MVDSGPLYVSIEQYRGVFGFRAESGFVGTKRRLEAMMTLGQILRAVAELSAIVL
jgi:hypothetical protein